MHDSRPPVSEGDAAPSTGVKSEDGLHSSPRGWGRWLNLLLLVAMLALAGVARCWNASDVFVQGRIFFVDPDCYSRMTRAAEIFDNPGRIVRAHVFENWPEGVVSHVTSPMDYTITLLAWGLKPFSSQPLDLAGAITPVVLGLLTLLFLWYWAGRLKLPYRGPLALLFGVSPILVHGTSLGRPDHQALQIFSLAVALGAEFALLTFTRGGVLQRGASERSVQRWGIVAGAAWGLSLWVSLYEPGILLGLTLIFSFMWHRHGLWAKARWAGYAAFAAVVGVAALTDGWHWPLPSDPDVIKFFPNWSHTIEELRSVAPWAPLLMAWSLALMPVVPFMLVWGFWKGERRNAWWLCIGTALLCLTCWQVRWGYFFALAFVMMLPMILGIFRRRWIAITLFILALWPVARDWERQLALGAEGMELAAQRQERRLENVELRTLALAMKQVHGEGGDRYPILAPWWLSPAFAYWSGQPLVAGSSHQSLPGTVDSSRFYRSVFWPEAAEILARRKVCYVLAYIPERVLDVSEKIIGNRVENPALTMASILFKEPQSPPIGLELEGGFTRFKVYRVKAATPSPRSAN